MEAENFEFGHNEQSLDSPLDGFSSTAQASFVVVLSILFLISFVGNLMIIVVMIQDKKLRQSSASCYIVWIAIADLVSAVVAPIWGVRSDQISRSNNSNRKIISQGCPSSTCRHCGMFFFTIFILPINFQVALSVDRFWAVCYPLSFHVHKDSGHKKWIILFCIALAGLIGVVPIALGKDYVGMNHAFSTWALMATATIVVLHCFIIKTIQDYVSIKNFIGIIKFKVFLLFQGKIRSDMSKSMQNMTKQETRLTKTMAMVIGSYLICWMPMTFCLLGVTVTGNHHHEYLGISKSSSLYLHTSFFFLAYMNSAIDPLIYIHRMKEVKRFAKKILMCGGAAELPVSVTSGQGMKVKLYKVDVLKGLFISDLVIEKKIQIFQKKCFIRGI